MAARIGCVGWGSLLWDPRSLPMAGAFRDDGPRLPIEFSRVARDGRVTLVIDPDAAPIPTYWVPLDVPDVNAAVEALGRRERIGADRWREWIGLQTREHLGSGASGVREGVGRWLADSDADALVWTALPRRCPDGRFAAPSDEELLSHLRALEGESLRRAEEYVRRAPAAVRTPRRARFEQELGWTPSSAGPNPATPGVPEAPPDAPTPLDSADASYVGTPPVGAPRK